MLEFVVYAALTTGALQDAALAIGALQLLEQFVAHAALAIGTLQVLVVTSLCLFVCYSCPRGFADA